MIEEKTLKRINRYVLLPIVILFIYTFLNRHNYKKINGIHLKVLKPPSQTKTKNNATLSFKKNGYIYKLTPLYDYEVSGLVLSKISYDAWHSIYKTDKVFTTDLCLVWGSNAAQELYKDDSISFSQDSRGCSYQSRKGLAFNQSEFANTHLVVNDPAIAKKTKEISVSDQVRIKGKLVNVKATLVDKGSAFDKRELRWTTSTKRSDAGDGACEIVFVEDIEILTKGNEKLRTLSRISFYVISFLVVLNLILLSRPGKKLEIPELHEK